MHRNRLFNYTMFRSRLFYYIVICCISLFFTSCIPSLVKRDATKKYPASYNTSLDSANNTAMLNWKQFITDPYLTALIDTALRNNQALNIMIQQITLAQQEVRLRKGKYLPFVNIIAGAGFDKEGQYTRLGSVDATDEIMPGKPIPTTLPDFLLGASVSWQVDIWKQLRNARKSATYEFLATNEGRKFMVTNLVAEISYAYYELMALDNQLNILKSNIQIQSNALNIVTLQKAAGQVTELAVLRFQAEVRKNQSRQYYIQQQIIQTQNRINFLVGRYPQIPERNSDTFNQLTPDTVYSGIPSQLLENRPDVKQAELELEAAKLNIKVAKANFLPVFNITGAIGFEAFNPKYLLTTPESMLYNLVGGLVTPFINRNGIKAMYYSANAKQIQAVYNYERTILQAYTEVVNQQAKITNLANSYNYKAQQVDALSRSIEISINLFKAARADYVEVLMTTRDALESKIELVETKKQQMNARIQMYQVLGGGWR